MHRIAILSSYKGWYTNNTSVFSVTALDHMLKLTLASFRSLFGLQDRSLSSRFAHCIMATVFARGNEYERRILNSWWSLQKDNVEKTPCTPYRAAYFFG